MVAGSGFYGFLIGNLRWSALICKDREVLCDTKTNPMNFIKRITSTLDNRVFVDGLLIISISFLVVVYKMLKADLL
jgi:hypothetical protein